MTKAGERLIKSVRWILERYRVYQSHDFDPETQYCVDCGQESDYAIRNAIMCFGSDKLVAISHLRRPYNPDLDEEYRGADTIWKNPA